MGVCFRFGKILLTYTQDSAKKNLTKSNPSPTSKVIGAPGLPCVTGRRESADMSSVSTSSATAGTLFPAINHVSEKNVKLATIHNDDNRALRHLNVHRH